MSESNERIQVYSTSTWADTVIQTFQGEGREILLR